MRTIIKENKKKEERGMELEIKEVSGLVTIGCDGCRTFRSFLKYLIEKIGEKTFEKILIENQKKDQTIMFNTGDYERFVKVRVEEFLKKFSGEKLDIGYGHKVIRRKNLSRIKKGANQQRNRMGRGHQVLEKHNLERGGW